MMSKPSIAVKAVNHFDEAIDFGKEYLAKKQPENNHETENVGGRIVESFRVKLDIGKLVDEMHKARGVLYIDSDDVEPEEVMNEILGFQVAIVMHMHEQEYFGMSAEYTC